MTDLLTPPTRSRTPLAAPAALLAGALTGLLAGGATAWLQGVLPGSWHVLADSGAVWTAVAFAVAAAMGRARWVAVGTGALTLFGEVAGYYVPAAHVLGFDATVGEQVLWTVAALWIGPLAGLAAHTWRCGTPAWSAFSVLALSGVVAGEGLHQALRVGDAAAGWAELGVALVVAAVLVATSRADRRSRAVAAGGGVVVCLATYLVYGQAVLS